MAVGTRILFNSHTVNKATMEKCLQNSDRKKKEKEKYLHENPFQHRGARSAITVSVKWAAEYEHF